jgi:hypothetical protein
VPEYAPNTEQRVSRKLGPRDVIDMHADLQRLFVKPDPWIVWCFKDYALRDVAGAPAWGMSHLHPATRLDDLDPWVASLGTDLFGATTYQVTAEMVDLAEGLRVNTPDLGNIREEDLPSEWGFMWFDKPVPRPSVEDKPDQEPLLMHAISWAKVPSMPVTINGQFHASVPALRVREWGFNDDMAIRPRPLHLMGQSMVPLTDQVHTPLTELWFVHMVWILMGMEITARTTEQADRHGRKRAANLKHAEVTVITLRRPARAGGKPSATPKLIDWSCTWLVRGHYRKAPHGGTYADGRERTWIRPHIKGPDGMPLRSADILYKLAR